MNEFKIPTPLEMKQHHLGCWDKLPDYLKARAIVAAQNVLTDIPLDTRQEIRKAIEADPLSWITPYHLWWGMSMRNGLRDHLQDSALPTGNWDDYYVEAIERALKVLP